MYYSLLFWGKMAAKQLAAKRTAQNLNESVNSTPTKSVQSKIPKHNSTPKRMEDIQWKI
jgi:hypothetical protein